MVFSWNEDMEECLLKSVLDRMPFLASHGQKRRAWEKVAEDLNKMIPGDDNAVLTYQAVKDKVAPLITKVQKRIAQAELQSGECVCRLCR